MDGIAFCGYLRDPLFGAIVIVTWRPGLFQCVTQVSPLVFRQQCVPAGLSAGDSGCLGGDTPTL